MAPAPPQHITFRNLTSHSLTLTLLERFTPPQPPKQKIEVKNVKDIGNLAKHIGGIVLGKKPAPPTLDALKAGVESFSKKDVNIEIASFAEVGGKVAVKEQRDGEVVRVTFSLPTGEKFRVDIETAKKNRYITTKATALGSDGGKEITVNYLPSKAHLSFFSTRALDKWMGSLKDNTPLSSLSMPGTHNSPTCHIALPSVRCQAVGITKQLEHGVRYFDIRCQPDGKDLILVHGVFPISLGGRKYFRDVLKEFYEFLESHPTETIVVSLKREGPGDHNDAQFSKLLHDEFIEKKKDRWHTGHTIPTLGKVRGKCVLFRRFTLDPGRKDWGLNAEHWDYNTPDNTTRSGDVRVQDFCEVLDTVNIDKKLTYIREHLVRASTIESRLDGTPTGKDGKKIPLYVNFLSAANFWNVNCWPERIAEKANPAIVEFLQLEHGKKKGDGATGIVVCDFVGDGGDYTLCDLVVAMNSKLEVREKREEEERKKREVEAKKKEEEERKKKEEEEKKKKEEEDNKKKDADADAEAPKN